MTQSKDTNSQSITDEELDNLIHLAESTPANLTFDQAMKIERWLNNTGLTREGNEMTDTPKIKEDFLSQLFKLDQAVSVLTATESLIHEGNLNLSEFDITNLVKCARDLCSDANRNLYVFSEALEDLDKAGRQAAD